MREKGVIIGGSHASVAVIETLKSEGYRGRLTLISEERVPICSPTALPYLVWEKDKLLRSLRPIEFYQGLEVHEEKVVSMDPGKSAVFLQSGKRIHYDRLVIATGASAARLPFEIEKKVPIFSLRRLRNLEEIERSARKSDRILIIGAGLIGLHLAEIFSKAKKKVHIVELKKQVLPGLIPPDLADFLKGLYEEKGIRISLGTSLSGLDKAAANLSSGEKVKFDLAISAIGIRPNIDLVKGTPVTVGDGIIVNERMETSLPGIYACGDVAQFRDFFTGEYRLNPNVVNAAEQGKRAGESLMGKEGGHPGGISVNAFHCLGMNLFTLGRFQPEKGERCYREEDREKRVLKQMVFKRDRLKGMVLLNTPVDGGIFYRLLRERISLKGMEEKLLKDPFIWGRWVGQKAFKG